MLKTLLLIALLLSTADALGQSASGNLSVTVTPSGSPSSKGACPGGDSGFVPSGYSCYTAATYEFNGTSLDTSKWSIGSAGGNQCASASPQCVIDATSVTLSGGNLNETAFIGSDGKVHIGQVNGRITGPTPSYYVEVRNKEAAPFNAQGYMAGGFWWFGQPCGGEHIEIDAGPDSGKSSTVTQFAYNWFDWSGCSFASAGGSINDVQVSGVNPEQFQIYGIWVPGDSTIHYYINGNQVALLTGVPGSVNTNGLIFLTGQEVEYPGSIRTDLLPAVHQVDYIRYYCPGCR